ncbi:MAG: hypothetical protein H8D45_30400 [Bacteroidetes bacterium]|nr:hypothetical protein [Bacteroidota bacterium]
MKKIIQYFLLIQYFLFMIGLALWIDGVHRDICWEMGIGVIMVGVWYFWILIKYKL